MTLALLNEPAPRPTASPYVGRLASEIMSRFGKASRDYDGDRLGLLERLLDFAAHAERQLVEQRDRIAHLESLVRADELTGLMNRRGLEEALDGILASAARHNEQGLVCYIDLDEFKPVNDRFGHDAGDEVLCQVASLLNDNIRASDIAARIGGDEFVVVLVRTNMFDAMRKARQLHGLLNRLVVEHGRDHIPVHASLGIQSYGAETNARDLLTEADQAMYINKRARQVPARQEISLAPAAG